MSEDSTTETWLPLEDGHWHMVTIVRQQGETKTYVDGLLVESETREDTPSDDLG